MGTTVATNALLERKGAKTLSSPRAASAMFWTWQPEPPEAFVRNIEKPTQLYACTIETNARMDAAGNELTPPDMTEVENALRDAQSQGCDSVAICLLHGYRNPAHELQIGALAADMGFAHISMSHEVISLMKLVGRASTTVADAYLTPVLRDYVSRVSKHLPERGRHAASVHDVVRRADRGQPVSGQGRRAVRPAGGVVGAVHVGREAGFDRLIGLIWVVHQRMYAISPGPMSAVSTAMLPVLPCAHR